MGGKRLFTQKQVDPQTRAVTAGWPVVAEVDTTGWKSGLYTVVVRTADGGTNIPFVVRPDTAVGKVAIIAASMTWQAYNIWGGASLYKNSAGDFGGRSYAVSYDRPYDHALWGAPIAMGFDIPVARFADDVGIDQCGSPTPMSRAIPASCPGQSGWCRPVTTNTGRSPTATP